MPNAYATVPNVLPGNVTIGGDLTVSGNTIRIGAAAPFTRVQKLPAGGGTLSYNRNSITANTDVASRNISLILLPNASRPLQTLDHDGVGGQNFGDLQVTWGWNANTINFTGTTVEQTIFTLPIRGGFLGVNGGFYVRVYASGTTQGAVATAFRLKFGGVIVGSFATAVAEKVEFGAFVGNQGATNSQRAYAWFVGSASVYISQDTAVAVDTTVLQSVSATITLGATTDNWNSRGYSVGPVRSADVTL